MLKHEEVVELSSKKMTTFMAEQKKVAEEEAEREAELARQRLVEQADAARRKKQEQRVALERKQRELEQKRKERLRGKGMGRGSTVADWEFRVKHSIVVGEWKQGGWKAHLFRDPHIKDDEGVIFYHNAVLHYDTGEGSTWDQPKEWDGTIDIDGSIARDKQRRMGILVEDEEGKKKKKKEGGEGEGGEDGEIREAKDIEQERRERLAREARESEEERQRKARDHIIKVIYNLRKWTDNRFLVEQKLRTVFNDFDSSGDGFIERKELKRMLDLIFAGANLT